MVAEQFTTKTGRCLCIYLLSQTFGLNRFILIISEIHVSLHFLHRNSRWPPKWQTTIFWEKNGRCFYRYQTSKSAETALFCGKSKINVLSLAPLTRYPGFFIFIVKKNCHVHLIVLSQPFCIRSLPKGNNFQDRHITNLLPKFHANKLSILQVIIQTSTQLKNIILVM